MSDDSTKPGVYLRLSPSDAEERAGYRISEIDELLWGLGPLGRVNLFVGSTSSGKSRLMRSILKQGEYEYHAEKGHVRSTGMAMASLQSMFGTATQPGPLRTLSVQLEHHLSHFKPGSSSSIRKLEHSDNYQKYAKIMVSEEILKQLRNIGIEGNDIKQYSSFLQKETQLTRKAWDLAGYAAEIDGHKPNTDGFLRGLENLEALHEILKRLEDDASSIINGKVAMKPLEKQTPRRIYIPVLRNANPLQRPDVLDGVFAETVQKHYGLPDDVEISTGQELYQQMFDTRNNYDPHIRDRHTEFERFLSSTFFADARVEVVPAVENAATKLRRIKIRIGGVERELPSVGDGIQSLVILMYMLFRADPKTHIFIEEPENSLHPGLQRIILETMLTNDFLRKKDLRIFMTTHSNHLVDLSIRNYADASIFVFEKYPAENSDPAHERFLVRPANNARMHAIASLEALNSSVLMANCSIWVEGVTDRLYLRAYLDAYWRSSECEADRKAAGMSTGRFLEDIHYAFFEYAGSNLAHYVFDRGAEAGRRDVTDEDIKAQFIANRVFLVADQDAKKDGKHEKWANMADGSNQFYDYVTKGREVENMISAPILRELLTKDFIDDPKVTPDLINSILETGYEMLGLGKYLDDHFGELKASVKAESGTLTNYYKTKLAEQTWKYLDGLTRGNERDAAWNKLSAEAKTLVKGVDAFIRRNNPRVSV